MSLMCACTVASSALLLCYQLFMDKCSVISHAPASNPMQNLSSANSSVLREDYLEDLVSGLNPSHERPLYLRMHFTQLHKLRAQG